MSDILTNPGGTRTTRVRGGGGRFASSSGYFDVNTLSAGLAFFEFKMKDAMMDLAHDFAGELEAYAKATAPWNDRTGDARSGLTAEAYEESDEMGIQLYHTVDYGVWLEIRWNGRYAVIIPAIEKKGGDLLAKMRGMMDGIIFYE